MEIHKYAVDTMLPMAVDCEQIDSWWTRVHHTKKYPLLCSVVFAVLSVFHGPRVESTFSLMKHTLDSKSTRLNVVTLSALQTIKYALKSEGKTAVEYFSRSKSTPVSKALQSNMKLASLRRRAELSSLRKHKEMKQARKDFIKSKSKQAHKNEVELATSEARSRFRKRKTKQALKLLVEKRAKNTKAT